jgi:hypothetical protein
MECDQAVCAVQEGLIGAARDLSIARDLPALRRLHLYRNEPVDLTPLRGITQLTVRVHGRQKVHGAELLGEGSKIERI